MRVLKNYLYNVGYQLLIMILPLITTPYVSRVLGPNGVGDNAYTGSLVQYFVLIANLGIGLYGNREIAYVRDDTEKLAKTFWEIQVVKIITTLISMAAFFVFIKLYGKYEEYLTIQSLNIIAVAFDISWLYMGIEDFQKTVVRNTLVKIISVICIFIFVKNNNDVDKYIFILGLAILLGNVTLWPFLKKILIYKPKIIELNPIKHIKPTIMLFVPQIATQVYLVLNKTMLGVTQGSEYSGFYNYSDNLVKVVLALASSLGTVLLPHIANAYSNKEYERVNNILYKSFDYVTAISVPMAFGLASISHTLVPIFYGNGYYKVGTAMTIESAIIIFVGWSGTIGTQYLLPTNNLKPYTTSIILGAIVNIIINIPFIGFGSLYGAMIATVISEAVVAIYQIRYVRNFIEIRKLFKYTTMYIFAGITMFIPNFVLSITLKPKFLLLLVELLIGILIYGAFIILARKDLMIDIINKVVKKH